MRQPGLCGFRVELDEARRNLGAGHHAEALAHADEAIRRLPSRADAHVTRGLALLGLARQSDAFEAFRRALSLDPSALDEPSTSVRVARAAALANERQIAAAERAVAQLPPSAQRAELYMIAGDLALGVGPARLRDAIGYYREALRSRPSDPRVRIGLGLALLRAGQGSEARLLAAGLASYTDRDLDHVPGPETEREARRAVRSLDGDPAGVSTHLEAAAARGGPWAERDQALSAELRASPPPPSRARPQGRR